MISSRKLVEEYRKQIGKFTYKQLDCIKSIENIIRRYGYKAKAVGSNYWARHEIINLRPLTQREQLYDGCAVLKTKSPGELGYSLPDAYKDDAVQIDYYHIGLGTDSGEILDSTTGGGRDGPGVSKSPISPLSWDVIGDFKNGVDYSDRFEIPVPGDGGGDGKAPDKSGLMRVVAESGNTVNLRLENKLGGIVLAYVPVGEIVTVLYSDGTWTRVEFGKTRGWMMSKFLAPVTVSDSEPPPSNPPPDATSGSRLIEILEEADRLVDRLAGLLFEAKGAG